MKRLSFVERRRARSRKTQGRAESAVAPPSDLPGEAILNSLSKPNVVTPGALEALDQLAHAGHLRRARDWVIKLLDWDKPRNAAHAPLVRRLVELQQELADPPLLEALQWLATFPEHAAYANWHIGEHHANRGESALARRAWEQCIAADITFGHAYERLAPSSLRTSATWPSKQPLPFGTRYELTRVLGSGASSVVYAAFDRELDTEVAIKVALAPYDAGRRKRLAAEAKLMARLVHPHVVGLIDAHLESGHLVLERMESTVAERLQRGPMPRLLVHRWAMGLFAGLGYLHEQRIIHRDIKPSNLFVRARNHALVIGDFGLAVIEPTASRAGTMNYAAPEQREGLATWASDIFSAGRVLSELLGPNTPSTWSALLTALLDTNPNGRPHATEVVHELARLGVPPG